METKISTLFQLLYFNACYVYNYIISILFIPQLYSFFTALIVLYKELASKHIEKVFSSTIKSGYSLALSHIPRGLEIELEGLSDESIIMYLIRLVMKSKFCSLTSIELLYLVYYYSAHENLTGTCWSDAILYSCNIYSASPCDVILGLPHDLFIY